MVWQKRCAAGWPFTQQQFLAGVPCVWLARGLCKEVASLAELSCMVAVGAVEQCLSQPLSQTLSQQQGWVGMGIMCFNSAGQEGWVGLCKSGQHTKPEW